MNAVPSPELDDPLHLLSLVANELERRRTDARDAVAITFMDDGARIVIGTRVQPLADLYPDVSEFSTTTVAPAATKASRSSSCGETSFFEDQVNPEADDRPGRTNVFTCPFPAHLTPDPE